MSDLTDVPAAADVLAMPRRKLTVYECADCGPNAASRTRFPSQAEVKVLLSSLKRRSDATLV